MRVTIFFVLIGIGILPMLPFIVVYGAIRSFFPPSALNPAGHPTVMAMRSARMVSLLVILGLIGLIFEVTSLAYVLWVYA